MNILIPVVEKEIRKYTNRKNVSRKLNLINSGHEFLELLDRLKYKKLKHY
jgi:hypothetical protein